jgi:hypothetical protein
MDKLPRIRKDRHLSEGDYLSMNKLPRMRIDVHLSEGDKL